MRPEIYQDGGELIDAMLEDAMAKVEDMASRMKESMEQFDTVFDENTQAILGMAEEDLAFLKEPFTPVELDMNPGASIGYILTNSDIRLVIR